MTATGSTLCIDQHLRTEIEHVEQDPLELRPTSPFLGSLLYRFAPLQMVDEHPADDDPLLLSERSRRRSNPPHVFDACSLTEPLVKTVDLDKGPDGPYPLRFRLLVPAPWDDPELHEVSDGLSTRIEPLRRGHNADPLI